MLKKGELIWDMAFCDFFAISVCFPVCFAIFCIKIEGYKIYNRRNSGASLHSKTIVVDDKISWIGSFNLDGNNKIFFHKKTNNNIAWVCLLCI